MYYLQIKNKQLTKLWVISEKKYNLKFLIYNNLTPLMFKFFCLDLMNKIYSNIPILRCLISFKSKFVLKWFHLARLSLKFFISLSRISGIRKSSW